MLQQIINYYKLKATLPLKKEELLKIVDEIDPHSIQQWKDYISYQWRGDMSVVPTSEILSQRFGVQNIIQVENELVVVNSCSSLKNIDKKVSGLYRRRNLLEAIGVQCCLVIYNSQGNEAWDSYSKPQRLKLYNKLYNTAVDQLDEKVWCDQLEL